MFAVGLARFRQVMQEIAALTIAALTIVVCQHMKCRNETTQKAIQQAVLPCERRLLRPTSGGHLLFPAVYT